MTSLLGSTLRGLGVHLAECRRPDLLLTKLKKLTGLVAHGRRGEIRRRILRRAEKTERPLPPQGARPTYDEWLNQQTLTREERRRLQASLTRTTPMPTFALILNLEAADPVALQRTVRSLRTQSYNHWKLVRAAPGAALNRLLEETTAEYLVPLNVGDELAQDALLLLADALARHPGIDFLYTDEDEWDPVRAERCPHFKPDWSPEYFLAEPYTGRLAVYRTSACRGVGGFRPTCEGGHEFDLALRLTAGRANNVLHLPRVLYHRTANVGQPYVAPRTAAQIVADHLAQQAPGTVGRVDDDGHSYRIRFAIPTDCSVSIVIPTAGRWTEVAGRATTFVKQCVESIRSRSTYALYEIIVIDNGDLEQRVTHDLQSQGVRLLSFREPFNLSAKLNLGAGCATGDYLVLLNDDTEVITPTWLEGLLEYACQPGIGAVGAKLLFPDGRLQHVGVGLSGGLPGHPWYLAPGHHEGYRRSCITPRNYLAVTGACFMTPRRLFANLGGFACRFPLNYNDVDYCLRLREHGYRSVYTPHVQLYHHESVSKEGGCSVRPWEMELFQQLWGERYSRDPYHHELLDTSSSNPAV